MRIGEGLFTGISIDNQREQKLKETLSKLSSAKSINKAADSASGLCISEKMKAQIRGLRQAEFNVADTLSMLNTTDGGMETATEILQRMRELSVMSLNDTLADEDRANTNLEFQESKQALSEIFENTEFNAAKVYEEHLPYYEMITGNAVLQPPLIVAAGYNDSLKIWVDGETKVVALDEGRYDDVDEFLEMFDSRLLEADPSIIASLDKEHNTLNLSAEGYDEMRIAGGGASFIYDYYLGRGAGTIYGSSDLSGRLHIIAGSNDQFSFNLGSKRFNVNFPSTPGGWSGSGYSADEIVSIMNTQLQGQGALVNVYMHGNNIAIDPGMQIIDGFSGNMIKIDGITSILYDNAMHGTVVKTQGYSLGRINLFGGATITENLNDSIKFTLDGSTSHTITLAAKSYANIGEIVDEINTKLNEAGIQAYADYSSSGTGNVELRLNSKSFGTTSRITLDASANVYDTLFRFSETTTHLPYSYGGGFVSPAIDSAINSLAGTTVIVNGVNDQLKLMVDGTPAQIIIPPGSYTQNEMIVALNAQFSSNGIPVITTQWPNSIRIMQTGSGSTTSLGLDASSSAYQDIFCYIDKTTPTITNGTTTTIPPPEGSTNVSYVYSKAQVTGSRDLSAGLSITAANDTLNFSVSGATQSITLDHNAYNASQLIDQLNEKLSSKGLTARLSSNLLIFESIVSGAGQTISALSGSAYEPLLVNAVLKQPVTLFSTGQDLHAMTQGRFYIGSNPTTINSDNNELNFTYNDNGIPTSYHITLNDDSYTNIGALVTEINSKLDDQSIAVTANNNDGYIQLMCDQPGNTYSISSLSGGFYDNLLVRTDKTYLNPINVTGTFNRVEAFIVGRKSLPDADEIVINPHINDTLSFNYWNNGSPETIVVHLTAGKYTPQAIATEINTQLHNQGIDYLQAEYGTVDSGTTTDDSDKLVIRDLNIESGSHIVDGVRGNAAYTLFYPASADPSPTYTIGVTDVSSGIEIITGKNESLAFDENGTTRKLQFPAGFYDASGFLSEINAQLSAQGSEVIASYFEGRLKLSFENTGYNTIDNFTGNGRSLIFNLEDRNGIDGPNYQVGANTGQTVKIDKPTLTNAFLHIHTTRIDDRTSADKSLIRVDRAISQVSSNRGYIGAFENRLEHVMNNLENYDENLASAESRISDLDMAKAMTEFIKEKLLEDASLYIRAQGRLNAESVLKMLK